MRCVFLFMSWTVLCPFISAQMNDFEDRYHTFRKEVQTDYRDFRSRANREYAEFVRKAWKQYEALPAVPRPKEEEPVPPTIYPEDEKGKPIESNPIRIDEVVPVPRPIQQPKPAVPIKENPQPVGDFFSFCFLGTEAHVRLNDHLRFRLSSCSGEEVARVWEICSRKEYDNVVRDCLKIRMQHSLCDWAYLLMLKEMTDSFFGANCNESVLLMAYLYCQSGYKMRLGQSGDRLVFLYASRYDIYDQPFYEIDGEKFYPVDCREKKLHICAASFPDEQSLSLAIHEEMLLEGNISPTRILQAKGYPEMKAEVSVNKNLMNFYSAYPASEWNGNFMTRWGMYADTPLHGDVKNTLYPALLSFLKGKSQREAVTCLLNFVQTAFVYEHDDKVWGKDRAFFAEETLYYPYCDCEDRSILFSRLVRDLLGLKAALVYYPGHLAAAVSFTGQADGDYIVTGNVRYTVCDPTYINAPVGVSMPGMDNRTAKVILLR